MLWIESLISEAFCLGWSYCDQKYDRTFGRGETCILNLEEVFKMWEANLVSYNLKLHSCHSRGNILFTFILFLICFRCISLPHPITEGKWDLPKKIRILASWKMFFLKISSTISSFCHAQALGLDSTNVVLKPCLCKALCKTHNYQLLTHYKFSFKAGMFC